MEVGLDVADWVGFWVQIWALNTAGQLELTFSHPEEESQADSRNVSGLMVC